MTNQSISPSPKTPASRIIARFGAKRLAQWTGRHVHRVYAWAWPPSRNGTGGVIPHRLRSSIIDRARQELGEEILPIEFEPAPGEVYLFEAAE